MSPPLPLPQLLPNRKSWEGIDCDLHERLLCRLLTGLQMHFLFILVLKILVVHETELIFFGMFSFAGNLESISSSI